ncbi:hypothetical protein QFZ67_000269 [Streptomyces sp. V1I1]|nr:hypothetical protein [Streptomyces sp. V1I1]
MDTWLRCLAGQRLARLPRSRARMALGNRLDGE